MKDDVNAARGARPGPVEPVGILRDEDLDHIVGGLERPVQLPPEPADIFRTARHPVMSA
jgi:hypothetical protein